MSAGPEHRFGDRAIEILAVLLLGIATVGSAWCGYQATRWNGEETDLSREEARLRLESSRQFGLATAAVAYDSNLVALYAEAVSDGDEELRAFYRTSLMRPDFLPVLDVWEAEFADQGRAETNLLDNEAYMTAQFGPSRELDAEAAAVAEESQEAGANADDFIMTTLLLASALFFSGVTTSFRVRFARVFLLAASGLSIAVAAARLAELPVA